MLIVLPLVVIHDFDVPCLAFTPPETNPPLIINADAMLTPSVTLQGFEAVAWRDLKIIDLLCRIDGKKFGSRASLWRGHQGRYKSGCQMDAGRSGLMGKLKGVTFW